MNACIFTANAKSQTISADYTVEICVVTPKECMVFEEKEYFGALCSNGCKNYARKWSCPPYSPSFSSVALGWSKLYILYLRMPMQPFAHIKNGYLRIKAANSMLKSRADKYMRTLAMEYGKFISTGSCRLCKPCKCSKGEPCAHPSIMAYSFESLGINVDALVKEYFKEPLLWYKKGSVPEYTSVVCGLLTNEDLSLDILKELYLKTI